MHHIVPSPYYMILKSLEYANIYLDSPRDGVSSFQIYLRSYLWFYKPILQASGPWNVSGPSLTLVSDVCPESGWNYKLNTSDSQN